VGLATSQGIVVEQNGSNTGENHPPGPSIFLMTRPVDRHIQKRGHAVRTYHILLVDDDPLILKTIGHALKSEGYTVTTAISGEAAIEYFETTSFDLLITDLVMGSVNGIDVLKKAKETLTDIAAIILTGYGDISTAIEALRSDADDYLNKPCGAEEILFKVSSCIEKLESKRTLKLYENILPVCSVCKKIRDDTGKKPGSGEWVSPETFLVNRAGIDPSHTCCPECEGFSFRTFYPEETDTR
jgi:ActR/RegA family two-component response regulator